jgi:ATP-dependent DNA helicase 2 subunit 1
MSEIIRLVTFKSFAPSKYPNPALQWHYRILQAIALEEELPQKAEDKTIPKYSLFHKRIGNEAHTWGELLNHAVPAGRVQSSSSDKRRGVFDGEEAEERPNVKREKKQVEKASRDKIESLYEQGTLMTV